MIYISLLFWGKENMKKIFRGIIIVLMLLLTAISAISEANIEDEIEVENQNKENSGKPDLIITNLWFSYNGFYPFPPCTHYIGVTVKNIGDEKVEEDENITITIIVKKWFFIKVENYKIEIKGGLEPGKRKKSPNSAICDSDYVPGFYKFECYVNPYKTIDESDYLNNDFKERTLYLLAFWIEFKWYLF